ncbi:hypothetical protein G3T14_15230 [Methylobacterium sp. BTF04]|uniref:hypothetical protein n=1 Tax=Methylobacterium sp. BTF04 TaxID=2708300 RepID=UPI0013CFDEEA|nr:hypothetical protein [Methylobacterium sp. BTF04]NEU13474.1 hypothetical protein [Methylobacterium sp. BTF04]
MQAGGVSDIIAHFAGHLHIPADEIRLREALEDPARLPRIQPWMPGPSPEANPDRPLDELPSQPYRAPSPSADDTFPHFGKLPHPDIPAPAPHLPQQPQAPLPPPLPTYGGGGGGAGHAAHDFSIEVSPDQGLVQVLQLNELHDDDVLLMVPGTHPEALHTIDAASTLDAMMRLAAGGTPADLALYGRSTQNAVDLVDAHAASIRASPDAASPDSGTLGLGTYVDGLHQADGTKVDFTVPTLQAPDEASHDGLVDQGLAARTGGNLSINIATIFDDHTEHGALLVQGNAYSTDLISQTNVLVSQSVIEAAGDALTRSIVTDGNTTHNAASIAEHPTGTAIVQHLSLGTHVAVDRIDGDFYDVRMLTQANLLSDHDVTVQASFGAYYVVGTGDNTQINELPVSALNGRYDLIVVQGDHHTANLIFQTNVLLNDTVVDAYTARSDTASQSIVTGDNALSNAAAINHYGTKDFQEIGTTLGSAVDHLAQGHVDPALAALLPPAYGDTLNVLFITGDFYNINAISQTNIVSNVDTVIQYSPNPGTQLAATGAHTTSTQSVNSGDNQLSNLAAITTVGTTSTAQFVGGTHYDDAMLFQTNIVSDSSRVTIGDTQTLAHEVVAFTGLAAPAIAVDHPSPPAVTVDTAFHQDLFHGMLS